MKINIAVVQFESELQQPEKNLEKADKFLKKSVKKGADLVVFPEYFLTGPIDSTSSLVTQGPDLLSKMQELAKKYEVDIVPGTILVSDVGGLYNVAYYINSDGSIAGYYSKINLTAVEKAYVSPGVASPIIETRFGKMGLIICWDLLFPEMFANIRLHPHMVVICPSHWSRENAGNGLSIDPKAEEKLVNNLAATRAMENQVIFVYCNAAGNVDFENHVLNLVGQSQITTPFRGAV